MSSDTLNALLCPYLKWSQVAPVACGPWLIGSWSLLRETLSEQDAAQMGQLVGAFDSNLREMSTQQSVPVENPVFVWSAEQGLRFNERAAADDLEALQTAFHFTVLNANRRMQIDREPWPDHSTVTSDSSRLQLWKVDQGADFFSFETGGLLVSKSFELSFDDGHRVPVPIEVRSFPEVSADFPDFGSVYEAVKKGDDDSRRIALATRWLVKAWYNSASISMEDRIVFLKTGFEALTGESSTPGAAKKLRTLFGTLGILQESEDLLWSPVELSQSYDFDFDHFGTKKTVSGQTDLQCWFGAFGGARNDIIHTGHASPFYNHAQGGQRLALVYQRTGSRYNGRMVFQGQRLLLESIQALLHHMGFKCLWLNSWSRPT